MAAWHDLGTVLKELHQYDEAVSVLDHALSIDPKNALTHYYHGAALAMAARPQEAVESYRQAVTLDPKLPGAHLGLGHVLKTVGDQAAGIEAYRRAIELRPNYVRTMVNIGLAHNNEGEFLKATNLFLNALILNPNAKHIWSYARQALLQADRFDLIEKLDKKDPRAFAGDFQLIDPNNLP